MLRRISALVGILLILGVVTALVATVHRHRERMIDLPELDETVPAAAAMQTQQTRGEPL